SCFPERLIRRSSRSFAEFILSESVGLRMTRNRGSLRTAMTGNLFIVSAPSGAGKSSLVSAALAEDKQLALSVSYTTRPPREGEANGREYHFVDRKTFEAMLERGERSEEHTSELQSPYDLVCRLLLEKKKRNIAARG